MEEFDYNSEVTEDIGEYVPEEDSDFDDIDSDTDFEEIKGAPETYETMEEGEKTAVIVSVYKKSGESEAMASLDELERLFDTAGGKVVGRVVQMRDRPDGKTCVGSGKLAELSELCASLDTSLVIFDTELSPVQIREIENGINGEVSVIDRSMLILDIFASHARTSEGRLQVELAQLKYTSPRLLGKGKSMSRLGGGVGTRGPGESKLEIDRRRLKTRIHALERELETVEKNRLVMRQSRDRSRYPKCAIVGYTNAGKSTLLNKLTDAGILAENKLFATLDPTTRQFELPDSTTVLLTDTVGFIRNLPHHLIKAFKSTLDEAVYADILLIVADASDPDIASQMAVTKSTLDDLGATGKPTIILFNKCDAVNNETALIELKTMASQSDDNCFFISAATGEGIDGFVECLEELAGNGKKNVVMNFTMAESGMVGKVYKLCEAVEVEYTDTGIRVTAIADAKSAGQLSKYIEDYDILFPKIED